MDEMLIDREKEVRIINGLVTQRKNIIIFGEEGVGKTAIINKVLADQFNAKKYLYSEESKTFREALMGLVSSSSNIGKHADEKNILELRKALYPILDKRPEYIIFDHIGYVEPKYYAFLEYLIDRNLPLIVISQGTDKKAIGHLRYLLHCFERVEILNFSRVATDILVVHYINEFNIKIVEPDNFKKSIFHFSNGNPKIVKQICSLVRDTKYQKKGFIDVNLINLDRRINLSTLPKVNVGQNSPSAEPAESQSEIMISQMTPEDVAIYEKRLRHMLKGSHACEEEWIDRIIDTIKNPASISFSAKDGDRIVGCITGAEPGKADKKKYLNVENVHYLVGIITSGSYEGQYPGRKLLRAYIDAVAKTGQYRYVATHIGRSSKRFASILYGDYSDMIVEEAKMETDRGRLYVLDLTKKSQNSYA